MNGQTLILFESLFNIKKVNKIVIPIIAIDVVNSKLRLIKNKNNDMTKIIKKFKLRPSLKSGKKNAEKTKADPGSGCSTINNIGINRYKEVLKSVFTFLKSD